MQYHHINPFKSKFLLTCLISSRIDHHIGLNLILLHGMISLIYTFIGFSTHNRTGSSRSLTLYLSFHSAMRYAYRARFLKYTAFLQYPVHFHPIPEVLLTLPALYLSNDIPLQTGQNNQQRLYRPTLLSHFPIQYRIFLKPNQIQHPLLQMQLPP